MRTRLALIGLGTLVGVYGGWLLLSRQDFEQLRSVAVWFVAGVLLHDVLLSGLVVALGLVGSRLLPMALRRPATIALIVIGTVTIAAVPVLGRFGAKADNPTLLDRNYVVGWLVFVVLVLVALALLALVEVRALRDASSPGSSGGPQRASKPSKRN